MTHKRHTFVSTMGVDMTLDGQGFAGPPNWRKSLVTLDFLGGTKLSFDINDRHLALLADAIKNHLSKEGV